MPYFFRRLARITAPALVLLLAACAGQEPRASRGTFDPYEQQNRAVHDFNRDLDRALVRPLAKGYDAAIPDDIETALVRVSTNVSVPSDIVNSALQLNMRGAIQDTARLFVNTTVGLGGLFDPATEMGMPPGTDTDFGETLHVWGAGEGPYIALPLLGPSTQRDTYGLFVDLFTDPLTYIRGTSEIAILSGAAVVEGLSQRSKFSGTIDQILYESADSYAQVRSIYLQQRRFELGGSTGAAYDDPYANGPATAVMEDPYDQ